MCNIGILVLPVLNEVVSFVEELELVLADVNQSAITIDNINPANRAPSIQPLIQDEHHLPYLRSINLSLIIYITISLFS
jgi:hypothetical protein